MNETFFCTKEFVTEYAQVLGSGVHAHAVTVDGSGPRRAMYALRWPTRYCTYELKMAPHCLYASPGWEGSLERSTVEGILRRVTGARNRSLEWHVRFDHPELAAHMISLGMKAERKLAHIVPLLQDYEEVASKYESIRRYEVRRAPREGVVVGEAACAAQVDGYLELHRRCFERKNVDTGWPERLIAYLASLRGRARLFVAEHQGRIVAGGLFCRDGSGLHYVHGARDPDFKGSFLGSSVMDAGIRWGCATGCAFLNLANSGGRAALEHFKKSWGTREEWTWYFRWENPLWARLGRLKKQVLFWDRGQNRSVASGQQIVVAH